MKERNAVMETMQIFEPALCCPTGLCGVGVDPELLRISTVLDTLEKDGKPVARFNLNNTPMEFVANKIAYNFINKNGVDGLPIVVVGEKIVLSGRYPTNNEFAEWLGVDVGLFENQEDITEKSESSYSGGGDVK